MTLYAKWQYRPYLAFKSSAGFSVSVSNRGWNGNIQYSYDGENWSSENWDGNSVSAQQADNGSFYLYFRGKDNTVITGNSTDINWCISGTDVKCCGNIMTLLDWEEPDSAVMGDYCFSNMFSGCTGLTSAPALPATTLAGRCYSYMFSGCTGLTSAPALPATTLANFCYGYMFKGCTGLTSAPALPATTLASNCYVCMFKGCTGLKVNSTGSGTLFLTMPETFPSNPVRGMFSGTGGSFTSDPAAGGTYYYE